MGNNRHMDPSQHRRLHIENALRNIRIFLNGYRLEPNYYKLVLEKDTYYNQDRWYIRLKIVQVPNFLVWMVDPSPYITYESLLCIDFPDNYGLDQTAIPMVILYKPLEYHRELYPIMNDIKLFLCGPHEQHAHLSIPGPQQPAPSMEITIKKVRLQPRADSHQIPQETLGERAGGDRTQLPDTTPAQHMGPSSEQPGTTGALPEQRAHYSDYQARDDTDPNSTLLLPTPQSQTRHDEGTMSHSTAEEQLRHSTQPDEPVQNQTEQEMPHHKKNQQGSRFGRHPRLEPQPTQANEESPNIASFVPKTVRKYQLPRGPLPQAYHDMYFPKLRYHISEGYRGDSQYRSRDPLRLVMLRRVFEHIYNHARGDLNNERFGILIGGALYDEERREYWVEIVDMLEARDVSANVVSVQVSSEELSRINARVDKVLESTNGVVRKVGWYHTHPGHGIFMSGTDQDNQLRFYSAEWNIALVVDPRRNEYGFFYGPGAFPLAEADVKIISDEEAAHAGSTVYQTWQLTVEEEKKNVPTPTAQTARQISIPTSPTGTTKSIAEMSTQQVEDNRMIPPITTELTKHGQVLQVPAASTTGAGNQTTATSTASDGPRTISTIQAREERHVIRNDRVLAIKWTLIGAASASVLYLSVRTINRAVKPLIGKKMDEKKGR